MKPSTSILAAISLIAAGSACADYRDDHDSDPERGYRRDWSATEYLDQNWTPAEREQFYITPQGSYVIPYAWFFALKTPRGLPFASAHNIRRYGYLIEPDTDAGDSPERLPVGFAREPNVNGEDWVGYSCAACHTGELRYQGHRLRIDGAPTLADFTAFYVGIIEALEHTLASPARFDCFARRVVGASASASDIAALRARVAEQTQALKQFATRSQSSHTYGAGRVDAFGIIMNEVFGKDLNVADNVREPNAPVSYPFLWNTPQHDFVQWNGSAFNPFGRNVGEVLGTFGRVNLDPTSPQFGKTSARGRELFTLERLVAKLAPPSWPEDILGRIDPAAAERGKALYKMARNGEESCEQCHSLPDTNGDYPRTDPRDNLFGATFIKTNMTPLAEIGTDPLTANNFGLRKVKTGAVAGLLPAPLTGAPELPAPAMLSILVGIASQDAVATAIPPIPAAERPELIGFRRKADGTDYRPPNLLAYRARPLDGIWATGPYLHNGSVPSLYELLLPQNKRSTIFYVGNDRFDPKRVGYDTKPGRRGFRFDTRISGNLNTGHPYGTDLSESQRRDLLEFLKTL